MEATTFAVIILIGLFIALFALHTGIISLIIVLVVWLPIQNIVILLLYKMTDCYECCRPLLVWKEVFLLTGFVYLLLKRKHHCLIFIDYLCLFICIYIFIYAIIPSGILGVNYPLETRIVGFRTALIPFILYLFGRLSQITLLEVRKIIKYHLVLAVIVVFFGFIEISLPYEFWLSLNYIGFKEQIVKVGIPLGGWSDETIIFFFAHYGGLWIRRMISTFGSPLHVAYFLILPIFILFSSVLQKTIVMKKINGINTDKILLFLFSIGLIVTLTRGPLLGLLISLAITSICYVKGKRRITMIALAIASVSIFLSIFRQFVMHLFTMTITLEDASAAAHWMAYIDYIERFQGYIWGIGLGQSGPVGVTYGEGGEIGESLYFTIASEMGLLGLFSFILVIFLIVFYLNKENRRNNMPDFLKVMTLALLISTYAYSIGALTTEHWRGFTMSGMYWFLLGSTIRFHAIYRKNAMFSERKLSNNLQPTLGKINES